MQRAEGNCNGDLSVHHVVPLEQGGTNALSNLLALCRAHHERAEADSLDPRSHTLQMAARETNNETKDVSIG